MDELRSQLRSLTGGTGASTAASSSSSTPGTSGSKRKRPQPFVLASAGGTTYEDKSNDFLWYVSYMCICIDSVLLVLLFGYENCLTIEGDVSICVSVCFSHLLLQPHLL